VFFDYFVSGDRSLTHARGSRIEGIGRPRVEASFLRDAIDLMVKVPDAAAVAAMHWLSAALGRRVGGSTGTIFYGALPLLQRLHLAGEAASVVLILCDGGERYAHSYYNAGWLAEQGIDPAPHAAAVRSLAERGEAQAWAVREAAR
jgi:cysteine synthase A